MGSVFRKGSRQSGQSTGSSNQLDAAGAAIIKQGDPLRSAAYGQLGNFLNTGQLPSAMTGDIGQQEQELASAKQGILNTGTRGGQLRTALAQLPLNRLAMRDQLRHGTFDSALAAGLGSFSAGGTAMGNAAANLNSLGQQRMAQNQQAKQGIGQAGGMLATSFLSDRRLKDHIRLLTTLPNGLGWYAYTIFGQPREGVMADEVMQVHPDAVSRHQSGYLMVNYQAL